jgi:molybdenum-dependent DNA-binding transcriptional regulator ModE
LPENTPDPEETSAPKIETLNPESQNGGGAGGQAANGEVVTQLLRHFDAMTKQQVQLIEMVQQMGDSMR